jgi:hypothetical protein
MLGSRQPLDGPVFEKLEHAEQWCFHVIIDHYDRRLGTSDTKIEPFNGIVGCSAPPPPEPPTDVEWICESVARAHSVATVYSNRLLSRSTLQHPFPLYFGVVSSDT